MNRERDIRVWALGKSGHSYTPYRYRVWHVWRILPRSLNPEHQHGSRGGHVPRHDVAVIITLDQMYLYKSPRVKYQYPYRVTLTGKHDTLKEDLWFAGSGFKYLEHIYNNYLMGFGEANRTDIVDCSRYLPKYWGKFICIKNVLGLPGIQNGGPLVSGDFNVVGVGCFEMRYNQDRIMVFTDVRYYVDLIYRYANIKPGEYYEYAYPHWFARLGHLYDSMSNVPYIPTWEISKDLFPLGK